MNEERRQMKHIHGHLWQRHSVTVRQETFSNWWPQLRLQLGAFAFKMTSLLSTIPFQGNHYNKTKSKEHHISWEIYFPYAGVAWMFKLAVLKEHLFISDLLTCMYKINYLKIIS